MAAPADRSPRVEAATRAAWRARLEANQAAAAGGVWLVTNRKGSGPPRLPPAEAAEEALRFGWMDSRPAKLDGRRSLLPMSPRRPGSAGSGVNKERARRLAEAGPMAPAGVAPMEPRPPGRPGRVRRRAGERRAVHRPSELDERTRNIGLST